MGAKALTKLTSSQVGGLIILFGRVRLLMALIEWRRRVYPAVQEARLPLLRLGWQLEGHEVRLSLLSALLTLVLYTDRTSLQPLPPRRPPPFRRRQPIGRNHRLPTSTKAPGHQGHLHQRPREGNLRQEPGGDIGFGEGGLVERCVGREAEEGDQGCQVYQRQCQRCLVAISQWSNDGLERLYMDR